MLDDFRAHQRNHCDERGECGYGMKKYTCEVCGRTEILTEEEAYRKGWDYPPFMGTYGVVSPRTCPDCMMMDTAWAAMMIQHKTYSELTDRQREAIKRIKGELGNMEVEE